MSRLAVSERRPAPVAGGFRVVSCEEAVLAPSDTFRDQLDSAKLGLCSRLRFGPTAAAPCRWDVSSPSTLRA